MKIKVEWMREKTPDMKSLGIMIWQKTYYSHVAIVFTDKCGVEKLFHATNPVVNIQDYAEYMQHHDIAGSVSYDLTCSDDYFYGYCHGSCGKEYGNSQMFVNQPLNRVNIESIVKDGDQKFICSELVYRVLREFTKAEMPEFDPDVVTPKDLYEVLIK